jgi:hypothetical protein
MLITSAALAAIFAKSLVFDAGPNNWQRFGRAGAAGWIRKDISIPLGNEITFVLFDWLGNCVRVCKDILQLQHATLGRFFLHCDVNMCCGAAVDLT